MREEVQGARATGSGANNAKFSLSLSFCPLTQNVAAVALRLERVAGRQADGGTDSETGVPDCRTGVHKFASLIRHVGRIAN